MSVASILGNHTQETAMDVQVTEADIKGAGYGKCNNPLARALLRTTGNEWWIETHSQGRRMRHGVASEPRSFAYQLDEETTAALVAFEEMNAFEPRTAVLSLASGYYKGI
jgi:hypothetical protein